MWFIAYTIETKNGYRLGGASLSFKIPVNYKTLFNDSYELIKEEINEKFSITAMNKIGAYNEPEDEGS